MNQTRWEKLMQSLGLPSSLDTFEALVQAYSEKHRHYHNTQHIKALLKHFDSTTSLMENPNELELAIWFHDAIYKPHSSTNELDSANWVKVFLSSHGCDDAIIDRVFHMIMATLHTEKTSTTDEKIIVDIDLTILGSPSNTYCQFEKDIRSEYKWVPSFLYKKKRKEILTSFLDRDRIYHCDYFFRKLEHQARENLKGAINAL